MGTRVQAPSICVKRWNMFMSNLSTKEARTMNSRFRERLSQKIRLRMVDEDIQC